MDTTSHIVIGFGLGMLAQIDSSVAASSSLSSAVLLGTVVGSNAPDFDYLYNLKGKGSYYRHHRGWSHSFPVLPFWGLAVSGIIYPFFSDISFLHLFLWTFIAVLLHVFLDLFNVYGTQATLPISSKWWSFDSIPLFDPFILILHTIGFGLSPLFNPGVVFLFLYMVILFYIAIRTIISMNIKSYLESFFLNATSIKIIPYTSLIKWGVLIETEEDFLFGVYRGKTVEIEHTLSKKMKHPELVIHSTNERTVSDFLSSTNYAYPFVSVRKNGFIVHWKDLRFRTNKFFPCLTITYISHDLANKGSYIGWLHSSRHYKKIVRSLENSFSKSPSKL